MKILNPQSSTLTNSEVLAHILSKRQPPIPPTTSAQAGSTTSTSTKPLPPTARKLGPSNYEAITREVLEYLSPGSSTSTSSSSSSSTPPQKYHPLPLYRTTHNDEKTQGFVKEIMQKYDLMKAEVIMLVNIAPDSLEGLDAIVEEVDERFSEQEQLGILAVVGRWLGKKEGKIDRG